MTYVITEPCLGVKDGGCVLVCPVDCIHPTPEELAFKHEEMLYIDARTCIDCGLCLDECPAGAIFHEDDLPEKWASYVERNAEFYRRLSA